MNNIIKRIIIILCVLTITLTQIEVLNFNNLVFADETNGEVVSSDNESNSIEDTDKTDVIHDVTNGGLEYIKCDNVVTITGYSGSSEEVVIPSEINSAKVLGIGSRAFRGNQEIRRVSISEGIKNIESNAFDGCSNLEEINLPLSLEKIGSYTFAYCKKIKAINLPNNLKEIGSYTFVSCEGLKKIKIPGDLKKIENYVFNDCKALKSVEIEEGVEEIGIGVFQGCENLESINLPNSIKEIGTYVFQNCKNLNDIELPEKIEIIGRNTFEGCENLKSIKIPNSVKRISRNTFKGCVRLTSIEIPASVTTMEPGIFEEVNYVTIYGEEGSYAQKYAQENSIEFKNILEKPTEESEVISGNTSEGFKYTSYKGIAIITGYSGSSEEVVIPSEINSVKVLGIGSRAFRGNQEIRRVSISEGIKNIESNAFDGCSNLEEINLPPSLEKIGSYTFAYCKKIKAINLPNNLKEIGSYTFVSCEGLKKIKIPGDLKKIENHVFNDCKALKSVEIEEGVEEIGIGVFQGCENLESINLPNSIKEIGTYVFQNCKNLNDIELPEKIEIIGRNTFEGCENLKSIKIPNSVKRISTNTFKGCIRLTSIEIPASVTTMESGIFEEANYVTIYGEEGSYAQKYAQKNNIPFEVIDNISDINSFKVLRRSATSLVLSWDKVSNAQGYEIYRSTNENGKYEKIKTITNSNILTSTSTGLESATSYYYKIRAYKENNGQKTYGKFTLLKGTTNLNKVNELKIINSTETSIRIGWDKDEKATGYEVFRSTSENGKYVRVNTITDNNITQSASPYLQSGKTYYYRVKAYLIVDGEKLYSNSAILQAKTKSFGAITGLKMEASTENSIRISWNYVDVVDGYEIFRSTSENGKYVKVKTITDNSVTSTASPNLENATTYYYKVRSYKTIDGNKQYGDFSIVKTYTKPKAVNNLVLVNSTEKNIKIAWDEVKGADGYEIFKAIGENGKYVKVGTTSDLNYVSLGIVKGQSYYYKVKAYKLEGNSKIYGNYSDVLKVNID